MQTRSLKLNPVKLFHMMQKPVIGIVSPCYNEELVLGETSHQLNEIIKALVSKEMIS